MVTQHSTDRCIDCHVAVSVSVHRLPHVRQLKGAPVLGSVFHRSPTRVFDKWFEEIDPVRSEPEMVGEMNAHGTFAAAEVQHSGALGGESKGAQELCDDVRPASQIPKVLEQLRYERKELERNLKGPR
jgi:hypothetical protein